MTMGIGDCVERSKRLQNHADQYALAINS